MSACIEIFEIVIKFYFISFNKFITYTNIRDEPAISYIREALLPKQVAAKIHVFRVDLPKFFSSW